MRLFTVRRGSNLPNIGILDYHHTTALYYVTETGAKHKKEYNIAYFMKWSDAHTYLVEQMRNAVIRAKSSVRHTRSMLSQAKKMKPGDLEAPYVGEVEHLRVKLTPEQR